MPGVNTPASSKGNIQVGYTSRCTGLGEGTTGFGSMLLALNGHVAATAVAVKFVESVLTGYVPLLLYFRYFDGTTQVAGIVATSEDGAADADLSGETHRKVDATGYTQIHCYSLYKNGGTIYMACDADPGSDGFVDYYVVFGKASA